MPDRSKWIDVSEHGAAVKIARFADGASAVAVTPAPPEGGYADVALHRAGFQRVEIDGEECVARPGTSFGFREMVEAFPAARIVAVPDGAWNFVAATSSPFVEATPDADRDEGNAFQVKYRPRSKVGTPVAMVPRNMAAALERALDRVERKHGDLDSWVAGKLGWTVDRMASCLSPEQVDAVALALHAGDANRGFVLADQTGLGKGRVLAACARAAALEGRRVVFMTEKANLFTDFWRDIADIGSEDAFGEPFMVNAGAKISDPVTGKPIHKAPKPKQREEAISSGELPDNTNLCLVTYSQINQKASKKAEFLKSVGDDAFVIADECHNAVGDSNTSANAAGLFDRASGVLFSSATFASRAENMAAYAKLFPEDFMRADELSEVLAAGGAPLMEVLSQTLAEDGVLVRREHDLSGIELEMRDDVERQVRNAELADKMSPILSEMANMSLRVMEIVDEKNDENKRHLASLPKGKRKAESESWTTANFGSRLSAIVSQFLSALTVDKTVEESLKALRNGEKPVIVVERTMEALMREIGGDAPSRGAGPQTDLFEASSASAGEEAPTFRDALKLMVDRMMTLSVRRGANGNVKEEERIEDADLLARAEKVRKMADGFPSLSLSPIDDVRERIEAEGYVVDEISARNIRVNNGAYETVKKRDRNQIIADFQGGATDVAIATGAGSTGLSLHASEKAKDQRPRVMIEHEISQNVRARVQFWGRVNRRGQTVLPRFVTPTTGLAFEKRNLAMQNAKVRALSASVTANAESNAMMDVPDLLNDVGNDVARRMLEDRPWIAEAAGIYMDVEQERAEAEHYFVNRLLSRLVLLPSDKQETVYKALVNGYRDSLKELEAKGRSPHGSKELEGAWRHAKSAVYDEGMVSGDSAFARPVTLSEIETVRDVRPMRSDDVAQAAEQARRRLKEEYGGDPANPLAPHAEQIKRNREAILKGSLPKKFKDVQSAMKASGDNAVKSAARRLKSMTDTLEQICPGQKMAAPDGEGGRGRAVLLDVRPPAPASAHFPGRYTLKYAFPGDEKTREISLAGVLRGDDEYVFYDMPSKRKESYEAFDEAQGGRVPVKREVLDGNLFAAVRLSREHGFGSTVTFAGADGQQRRGVLIPKSKHGKLAQVPARVRDPEVARRLLAERGGQLFTHPDRRGDGMILKAENGKLVVEIPKAKTKAPPFTTDAVKAVTGRYSKVNWWYEARLPLSRIHDLIPAVEASGNTFHCEGRNRADAKRIAGEVERERDSAVALTESSHNYSVEAAHVAP